MEEFVTTVHYRGFSFPIYLTDDGRFYTFVEGKEVFVSKENYEPRIREIVDRQLDLISEISQDAWIEWFDNAGHPDIRLKINGRIVKVWLVADPYKVDLSKITVEGQEIYGKLSTLLLK